MTISLWLEWLVAKLTRRETVRERHERQAEAARERAKHLGILYDPYPDAPNPKMRIRFLAIGGPFASQVEFEGYRFSEIDHDSPVGQKRVTAGMIRAYNRVERKLGPWEAEKAARRADKG